MPEKLETRKYKHIWLDYKICLTNDDGEPILGDDRWALLSAIERTGSIMGAANELGVSYRKVWGDLRQTEKALGFSFVERQRGGEKGGGTCLTKDGADFIADYEEFYNEFQTAVYPIIKKFKRKLKYGEE